jgi:hypothetical protein
MTTGMNAPVRTLPRVKLYGERNTGTHYFSRLVAANLRVRLLESIEPRIIRRAARHLRRAEVVRDVYFALTFRRNLGWKHMNPKSPQELRALHIDPDAVRFLMLTKNPYPWVISMMRHPYHLGTDRVEDIEQLVRRRWPCTRRENMRDKTAFLIDVWCTKTRSYLRLIEQAHACLVRYEDLLADPASSLSRVASTLGLQKRNESFVNIDLSAKREGRATGRTFESYREYYLKEQWRRALTPAAVAIINSQLDRELVERVGYSIISL